MVSAPTTRRLSWIGSTEFIPTWKAIPKRGLKRQASSEALNPPKRARTENPHSHNDICNLRRLPTCDGPLTLFVWGCGNHGSLGLGPDELGELTRPKRHKDQKGIMSIAAGGLHTLLLDEDGKVSTSSVSRHPPRLRVILAGLVVR